MISPQLVPDGHTVQAVPRNASVFENIPLAVTPRWGAVSVSLRTTARGARKVEALHRKTIGNSFIYQATAAASKIQEGPFHFLSTL